MGRRRVVMTGTRILTNAQVADVGAVLDRVFDALPGPHTMVHGGAIGVDMIASMAALNRMWSTYAILPDYEKYGKYAPLKRNEQMVDSRPDVVLAFWDGKSKGTKHTIDYARQKGIPVIIHRLDNA